MTSEHYKKTATKHSYLRMNETYNMFYCRGCHEQSFLFNMSFSEKSNHFYRRGDGIQCPKCKEVTPSSDIIDASGRDLTYILSHIAYFDNGDTVRLYLHMKEISFYSKKLQQNWVRTMAVFNIKTGQSYLYEPRYTGSGKRWKHYHGPRFMNFSLLSFGGLHHDHSLNLEHEDVKGLLALIQSKLQEKFSLPIKSIYDYEDEAKKLMLPRRETTISMAMIANYVRIPTLNTYLFNRFIDNTRFMYPDNKFAYIMRGVRPDCVNPIGDLVKAFKGPDAKSIRKMVMNDLSHLPKLAVLKDFKDVNNIRRLLEHLEEARHGYSGFFHTDMSRFLKLLLSRLPETIVTNKILNTRRLFYLVDAASLYYQILDKVPDYDFDERLTVREMHDIFSMDHSKLEHPNQIIEYTEEQQKLECDIDGYQIRLAKDTHELLTVGTLMKICVGGYGNRAVDKSLNIAVAYKDDKPVICFELSADGKTVCQAKLRRNDRPEGETFDVSMKFVEMNDMKINTWDLKRNDEVIRQQNFAAVV